MPEQKELIGHAMTATVEAALPEEVARESIRVRKAFCIGRLYVCALTRGWDDAASYLLDILRAQGFDVRKFTGEWKLIDTCGEAAK